MSTKVMEEKNIQQQTKSLPKFNLFDFVGETKAEFQKISWTSKDELNVYTKVVVGATFALGIGVYFMDILIQLALSALNVSLKFIAG